VPERWLEWDEGKNLRRIPEEKMPSFWGGPRACLGKDMARFEAKIVMEALTKAVDIKCEPGHDGKIAVAPVMFYKMGLPVTIHHRAR
jgi:cytochrome P450